MSLYGGVLSGGATAIGAWIDYKEYEKHSAPGEKGIARLYIFKAGAGFTLTALTITSNGSYAGPVIARLLGQGVVGRGLSGLIVRLEARAFMILTFRFLSLSVGGWLTVAIFAAQFAIWKFSPNALEDWLSFSAFGKKRRSEDAYRHAEQQHEALLAARADVGV